MESILTSIKKMLGNEADYDHFDVDIIIHINSVFMALTQIGVGPADGFEISGAEETWTDFLGTGVAKKKVNSAKTYTYLKVRLLFDPPSSSAAIEAMKELAKEYEWRLLIAAEPPIVPTEGETCYE